MKKKPIPVTFEERKLIEKYRNEFTSVRDIANSLGRWPSNIQYELKRCEGKYNADEAQLDARKRGQKKAFTRSKNLSIMNEKIEILEMQIEILTDQIKEILNGRNTKN